MCCVRWISSSPADPYRGQERHEDGRRVFYGVTRIAKECVALRKYKVLEEIQSIHWGAEMYMESRVDGLVMWAACASPGVTLIVRVSFCQRTTRQVWKERV